jgi:23S rRNA pseudouridine1911/1915/1917 synthase
VADTRAVLRAGARLVWQRPPWIEPDVPLAFAVLHEDADLLVVAKPGGLPTVPAGGFLEHTLLALVRRRWPRAVPVHRLGRGTSGLVAFALTDPARARLAASWRDGTVVKSYRALVEGEVTRDAFTVDAAIGPLPHARLGTVHAASADGRSAVSHVSVVERRHDTTLVDVRIETGRPHQIRIHLAWAGHPLAGDPLYGPGGVPRAAALPGDGGYRLHAHRLDLPHPATARRLQIWCSPPPPLRSASD